MKRKNKEQEFEKRVFPLQNLEIREGEGKGEGPKITGYAAVFNELSEEMWGFREMIAPGAFDDVLEDDVRATYNHDPNYVLGRSTKETLRIEQDDKGLRVEIDPPDTAWARDLLVTMRRGDVDQMSFAFRIDLEDGDKWVADDDGNVIRTIMKLSELNDVSVVTYPAYPQTTAEARARFDQVKPEIREDPEEPEEPEGLEDYLGDLDRDLGLKRMRLDSLGTALKQ